MDRAREATIDVVQGGLQPLACRTLRSPGLPLQRHLEASPQLGGRLSRERDSHHGVDLALPLAQQGRHAIDHARCLAGPGRCFHEHGCVQLGDDKLALLMIRGQRLSGLVGLCHGATSLLACQGIGSQFPHGLKEFITRVVELPLAPGGHGGNVAADVLEIAVSAVPFVVGGGQEGPASNDLAHPFQNLFSLGESVRRPDNALTRSLGSGEEEAEECHFCVRTDFFT
jgi:hypothetical protein